MLKNRFKWMGLAIGMPAVCIVLIQGCTVGRDYQQPSMEMPSQCPTTAQEISVVEEPNMVRWWRIFGDPDIELLIDEALKNNRDIKAAVYRIESSRAMVDYTTGRYYPHVDAAGAYTHGKASKDGIVQTPTEPDAIDLHTAGVDFQWEIDLFGRIKRSVESAEATYQASVEDYRNMMVTLLAEVCRNYIDLRTMQARIRYAQDNIDIQQRTLELTKNRYESEIVGELDVRQAEVNLANTQSEIPSLRIAETASLNRLAALLGRMPGDLKEQLGEVKSLPSIQDRLSVGLPADMLRQRPDIRRAERQLAAQTAQIGVATADLYPSLQLTGAFQIQSRDLAGLGNLNNKAYSIGPGVQWNLFDANRIKNTIKIEEAVTQQLLAMWEQMVLSAAEEVQNAMTAYDQQQQRKLALTDSVTASRRSVELVESLYKNGLTNFQNVLDSQRTLFAQQDKLALSEGAALQSVVSLYKAFGGGWEF